MCTGYGTLPITGAFQIELLYNTVQMFQVQFRLIAVHFSAQSGEISRDHIAYICCCHKHGVFLFYPFKIVSKQWRQQINAHKNMFNMSKYKSTAPMMYSSAVKSICNAFKSQQIQLPKMSEINAGQI